MLRSRDSGLVDKMGIFTAHKTGKFRTLVKLFSFYKILWNFAYLLNITKRSVPLNFNTIEFIFREIWPSKVAKNLRYFRNLSKFANFLVFAQLRIFTPATVFKILTSNLSYNTILTINNQIWAPQVHRWPQSWELRPSVFEVFRNFFMNEA